MERLPWLSCVFLIGLVVGCGRGGQAEQATPSTTERSSSGSAKATEQMRAEAEKLAALTKSDLEVLLRHCTRQAVYAAVAMSNKGDLLSCTIMDQSMSDNDLYNANQAGAAPSDNEQRMSWFLMNQQSIRDRLKQGIPMDEYLSAQFSFLCGKRDWSGDPGGGRTYTTWTCKATAGDLAAAGIGQPTP